MSTLQLVQIVDVIGNQDCLFYVEKKIVYCILTYQQQCYVHMYVCSHN